jgi:alanyl-tRNA synthetase
MNPKEIITKIINYVKKEGYPEVEPAGLLFRRKGYPFNPSAGHHIIDPILLDNRKREPIKFCLVERCLRETDISKIGISDRHLSFFEMIEFTQTGDGSKIDYVKHTEDIYNILTGELGLEKEKLFITILEKCNIDNLIVTMDDTRKVYELWKKLLGEKNIILTRGRRNFFITREPETPGGPGYEIYYKLPNGKYVEIASQVNYKYIFHGQNNITPAKNENLTCPFGLERLQMVFENKNHISEISTVKPIKEVVLNMLNNEKEKELYDESASIIADRMRAITFIIYDAQKTQLDKTQGKILRKFIKNLKSEVDYLGIEDKLIYEKLIDAVINVYRDRYPRLKDIKEDIKKEIAINIGP